MLISCKWTLFQWTQRSWDYSQKLGIQLQDAKDWIVQGSHTVPSLKIVSNINYINKLSQDTSNPTLHFAGEKSKLVY